jgi:hypothetical protein
MVAAAIGGAALGSVVGGVVQGNASKSAAQTSANAANNASATQQNMFNQSQADLAPYNQAGQTNLGIADNFYQVTADQSGNAWNAAQNHIPQAMTEANLIQTPGYAFNLSQGLRAVQNSNAAQGLGVSGAAIQGAGQYATGLADSTYQNQFNNQNTIYQDYLAQANLKDAQLGQIYGQITQPISIGENAAAQQGNNAVSSGQGIANTQIQAGNAQAAGITGSAAGYSNALSGVSNAGINYLGAQNALNSGAGQNFIDSGATF